jgi:pyrroline-5-carboxylate reductase
MSGDNQAVFKACEAIILSVKPQYFEYVLPDILPLVSDQTRILSIMAGISTDRIEKALGVKAHVVRIMPNTPALVGSGTAAICGGTYADQADIALARQIFAAVGSVVEVEERLINAVSGVSGSGPAYVYVMIQALADGGVRMGLGRQLATQLAAETVRGSAQMVLNSGEHPEALKDKVCSPGGTTIEAMYSLEKAGFRAALMEAVQVSTEKANRL